MLVIITKEQRKNISRIDYSYEIVAQKADQLLCVFTGEFTDIQDQLTEINFGQLQGFKNTTTGVQVTVEDIERAGLEEYQLNRYNEYPSIREQLDDLFHNGAFSADMTSKIQSVKDTYPLGE